MENKDIKKDLLLAKKMDRRITEAIDEGIHRIILVPTIIALLFGVSSTLSLEVGGYYIFCGLLLLSGILYLCGLFWCIFRIVSLGNIRRFFTHTHMKLAIFLAQKDNVNSIDIILKDLYEIEKTLQLLLARKKYLIYILRMDFYKDLIRYINNILPDLNLLLTDLRYDLQNRINQQKQLLESAKSEALDNIKGTTELEQVSELQRIRLDKQIKQFEELQKILIKT